MLFAAGPDEIPSAAAPSSASEALLPAHERLTRKLASDFAKGRETVAQTLSGVNAWSQESLEDAAPTRPACNATAACAACAACAGPTGAGCSATGQHPMDEAPPAVSSTANRARDLPVICVNLIFVRSFEIVDFHFGRWILPGSFSLTTLLI